MIHRHTLFGAHRLHRSRRGGLARVIGAVLGAGLLVLLLAFGFFALLALATVGGVAYLVRQLQKPATPPATATPPSPPTGVIEGEFVVLRDGARAPQA